MSVVVGATDALLEHDRPIRVLVVDDHVMFAEALTRLLALEPDLELVGTVATGEDAVHVALSSPLDVVLMDVELPGIDGVEATRRIREGAPDTQVMVITAFAQPTTVAEAIQAGACGFLPKTRTADEVADAIRRAAEGEMILPAANMPALVVTLEDSARRRPALRPLPTQLTPREMEILQAVADGGSTSEIAARMFISTSTVQMHVKNILLKLEVHSKLEAVMLALRYGLITLDG
jgi:DNA-binding NarL/FixJ family response regulator